MYKTNEVRKIFLDYFQEKGHTVVESSSLVPAEDPSLMFVNAGMVQFKNTFLGLEERSYTRATSAQKCVRISGKHNDFEAVGRTPRHHTFFEMLGNFSFGAYFKEEAITYAYDFIINVLELPLEKIWVSVYNEDQESSELWQKLTKIPEKRIVKLGAKDNFWSMGDIGPCGPCTEIHYDKGEEFSCGPNCGLGKCECDRYMEIWNLVFMEYNRDEKGELKKLPKPSVDTGMGLERIVSILQNVDSNYDIDIFTPLLKEITKLTGEPYDRGSAGFPFRVIADHSRSATFLISDGVLPSNEGRGYVLRRILRRAIRYGKGIGLNKPFLNTLVPIVVETMGDAYKELGQKEDFVRKVILNEEERFLETLSDGLKIAEKMLEKMEKSGIKILSGEDAFALYDTYGFPVELTEDFLAERDLTLDMVGFKEAMKCQKTMGKENSQKNQLGNNLELAKIFNELPSTTFKRDVLESATSVLGLFNLNGEAVEKLSSKEEGFLITENTPFYGEGGGQVGDRGLIYQNNNKVAKVIDSQKTLDGRIYHIIESLADWDVNKEVVLKVDKERRRAITANHSGTHLLHQALQVVLGEHANQKGSYVHEEYLRFDFSHFENITKKELKEIELLVNQYILASAPVVIEYLGIKEAKEKGAMAIFGEKYGDQVSVVTIGDISMELCGGTHVRNTSEIGLFKIISEGSVGSGLRRIEAKTGMAALKDFSHKEEILNQVKDLLGAQEQDILSKIGHILKENKANKQALRKFAEQEALKSVEEALEKIEKIGDIPVIIKSIANKSMEDLRTMALLYKDKLTSGVVVLASEQEAKVSLIVVVTKDLQERIHAGKLVSVISKMIGGGGGGKAEMAQAGGKKPEGIIEALNMAREIIKKEGM